jgi:hypothetical protein
MHPHFGRCTKLFFLPKKMKSYYINFTCFSQKKFGTIILQICWIYKIIDKMIFIEFTCYSKKELVMQQEVVMQSTSRGKVSYWFSCESLKSSLEWTCVGITCYV